MIGRCVVTAAICTAGLISSGAFAADESVDYLTQIKPLLEAKCYACHGVLKQEGDLRLETLELMTKGGDSGPALIAPNPSESLILERIVEDEDLRMPPADAGSALKPAEVALVRNWILQGANAPHEDIPLAPSEHWAFQRIEQPEIPASSEFTHPIDILLAAKRNQLGLEAQPPAERTLLTRRLYLDLVGLPPSLEQLHDERPWVELVDELLASPHHGERWGRHWMDIWRYTEWYGLGAQLRNSQKHIWRWRDWIISSLNADKGYDRMIQEMIAGDELAPEDPTAIAGTGFLARNYYLFNRTTWLDSTIEHTGKAFLGLTFNCAKCHDHKYDPLSQVDYYSLRAIFEPHQVRLDPIPGETNLEKDGLPRVFDDHPDAKTFLHVRGNPTDPDEDTEIVPRVPVIFESFQPDIVPVELPLAAYAPGTRDYAKRDHKETARLLVIAAKKKLAAARKTLADLPDKSAEGNSGTLNFAFADDFEKPDPEAWDIVGQGWEFKDGSLHQTKATRNAEFARLKKELPRDFDVTCRYTTTGGTMYKSVTLRFDASEDRKYANFVYTSAYTPGPKVQVAFTRGGSDNYPPSGQSPRAIEVGKPCELRFAVKDKLVNIWFNGEFVIAYMLPDRRPMGQFALSGFDATVAFHSLEITSLSPDEKLTSAKNAEIPSPEHAAIAVQVAEKQLLARQLHQKAVEAVIAADDARFGGAAADTKEQLAKVAARLQAEALQAQADHDLLAAGGDTKKAAAAQARMKKAQQKLADIEKGTYSYSGIRASRKALEGPVHKESDYSPVYSEISTGRRLALAQWMTSRDNPLTARVAVNHVWMRHFGEPLVESVFDFGLRTSKPLQAKLLDYLASEFMDSGWSLKHLHRLIVTSQAYRMTSSAADADPETVSADATNRYYWRMNVRRMEAQIVRDSLLQLSGELDPARGGPSVPVDADSRRRSVYLKHSRDDHDKFLTMFDDADLLQCYRRSESIVPQQALALANSELSMLMAQKIAASIAASQDSGEQSVFADTAFETLLCRPATVEERTACLTFCNQLRTLLAGEVSKKDLEERIQTRLVHTLLNHNDFISIR